ncbi:hypothetical protein [Litoribacillus peritrichatus]|uniref:Uncharacterized protein n=1 Tax=Litoribacillus peritrichatus TaxID=718191 RepID=A0ABP7M7G2_9GAMM
MSIFSQLLALACLLMFISGILYVLFGQVTVRKLRKNPKTKDALGLEFVSGWDIINVAQTLAFPKSWTNKLEHSPISSMYANAEILRKHTNQFDKILGVTFYWLFMFSGLSGVLLVLLNFLGLFDG